MIRRIELLPASHAARRRQRRNVLVVVVAGVVALLLLAGWWLVLGTEISGAEDDLAAAQASNAQLEAQIAELQRFAQLEVEIQDRTLALQTVMTGDVDWPALMTEVAMVLPGEVWLTSLTASAGQTEGATPVETETATVRVAQGQPFGRIQFQGRSLSMPGVAKWLIRLGTVKDFQAVWLNNASEAASGTEASGVDVVDFDSTLELNDRAASGRYQDPDDL